MLKLLKLRSRVTRSSGTYLPYHNNFLPKQCTFHVAVVWYHFGLARFFNPRLTGVFPSHDWPWGGAIFLPPSPQNSETTGPNYKIQKCFDRSGNFVDGNLILLTSWSPITLQVRSKSKCFTIWLIWFCRALRPYQKEISQCNCMDRT